jgi:hypothetical protein
LPDAVKLSQLTSIMAKHSMVLKIFSRSSSLKISVEEKSLIITKLKISSTRKELA